MERPGLQVRALPGFHLFFLMHYLLANVLVNLTIGQTKWQVFTLQKQEKVSGNTGSI